MNSNEQTNEPITSAKGQGFPNTSQQVIQLSAELQQRINILNARISNANLAYADLLREMDDTLKTMASTISVLQRENSELKSSQTNEISKTR